MERLTYVWNELRDWLDANFDKPMFQLVQGIVLGILIVIAVWAAKKAREK